MVWIISLGQVALGLLAVLLIIQPLRLGPFEGDVPVYFGQLIEIGFVGGHGTSAALGRVYEKMGYPEAQDLAFFSGHGGTHLQCRQRDVLRESGCAARLDTRRSGS